jgi:DNA invertase Pin-like site-specific DNA recombinase
MSAVGGVLDGNNNGIGEIEGMKAAIYCRVSTDGQTTDNQLPDIMRVVKERNYEITEIYKENETAWKRGHQKELDRAMNDGVHRKYDVFIIWALDRFCRQGLWVTLGKIQQLWQAGVKVVSPMDSWIETDNELERDLMLAMKASMAKSESDKRSERIRAGNARRLSNGLPVGGKPGRKDKGKRAERADKGGHHRYNSYPQITPYKNIG